MFAVILALYLINIIGKTARVERLVKEKTNELELEVIENELRRLSSAVEHSPSMVIISDKDGNIEYVNPKFMDVTGYATEEIKGKNSRILKSGEQPSLFYKQLWDTINSGREWRGEFHNMKKNGELYWELASISSIKDSKGKIINFIKVAEDITERRHLERLKDEFISTVSHELRTPLSIMREGVSQVVEGMHGEVNEKQRQVLSISLKNIDRLTRLISDLLDISRIEGGKVEIKKRSADIVALATRIVYAFYSSVSDKGLELRERYSKDTIEAEVDTDRITQVFTNLIGNAIKFTEMGYIEIAVEDKEDAVYCSVSDSGTGIPETELPRVFNKFEQFRPLSGCAGLGLAISKGIVEMHHGRIWAESRPGEGSRFIFTLPKGKGL